MFALALSFVASKAIAAECFLSHEDCEIIARELLMLDIQARRDEASLHFMIPLQRELKVIDLRKKFFSPEPPSYRFGSATKWRA
jgi:hypothetical protein